MEPKLELVTVNGKEYQLDIEQAKKLNLLKEKDDRVRSWDEFKEKYSNQILWAVSCQLTPHEAKALAAFSKLLKLRRDWIGEWEPDWENHIILKWCLMVDDNTLSIVSYQTWSRPLSFPTEQMAKDFLETFRDLIEEAKILI